jgi:hypothetical protein
MSDERNNPVQAVVLTIMRTGFQTNIVRKHDMVTEKHRIKATGTEEVETSCIFGNFEDEDLPVEVGETLGDLYEPATKLLAAINRQGETDDDTGRH